jgi:hypothetical protein
MSKKQAQVMRIIRAGGMLTDQYGKSGRYRLLDAQRNPIVVIQRRTMKALWDSERITQDNGVWIATKKAVITPPRK